MATLQIVLATTNKGKLRELAALLSVEQFVVLGLDDFPEIGPIEENGTTFAQNALIKARTVSKATGLLSLADDSGLQVDALKGRPGVYSARYGDTLTMLPGETIDQRNQRKLLMEMSGVPERLRTCRFVTSMACVRPDGRELSIEGQWEGVLLTGPRGSNGFGYDPLFFDPEVGCSAAELSSEQKNARSHRGKALRQMLARLPSFLQLPLLS
ncbi:MAG: RdgB/HAM1 family non-canonical purine NTP pyrophosphatase [Desulfovibrio sp.]|nr:RdgB/HAM1 family non-canonical purine NTP pyrophosphatase [Desulfovibrio sp.]